MVAHNKSEEEIGYLRFTMGDLNAFLLYDLLDANDCNGGVSGLGKSRTIFLEQIEKAVQTYNSNWEHQTHDESNEFIMWQHHEIINFLEKCLEAATKEDSVEVVFC